ncbi:NmrA family NAD(P)-binding protein [Silvibacterium acidisoli]|uniref:NmrA family NAD(P)-binding protein n=1 Tax=Acidobacteriaceae bacterium ZG23-2 TaxID=2883246 RepID=UPI00406BF30A
MANELFLICGATGQIGGTGRYAVDNLLQAGKKVRAFVHSKDERSEALARKGVEIAVGDLFDIDSVRAALEGVTAAYFVYPIEDGLLKAAPIFAQAARESGLKTLVNMSQVSARREAKSHAAFNYWLMERMFDHSGIPEVTHLRPTFFAENHLTPLFLMGHKQGLAAFSLSTGRHAPIAAEDQGRMIAAILQNPSKHAGKTYPLYGPKEYTMTELYAEISRVLGQEVKYKVVPEDEQQKIFDSFLSPYLAQHLREVVRDQTNGVFAGTDHVIEEVTGKPPMSIEEFVKKNWDIMQVDAKA